MVNRKPQGYTFFATVIEILVTATFNFFFKTKSFDNPSGSIILRVQ